MGSSVVGAALDSLLEALSRCLDAESSQRVANFHIDPGIQARVDYLAERTNVGALDETERAEYDAFVNAADFVSVLKFKARRQLGR